MANIKVNIDINVEIFDIFRDNLEQTIIDITQWISMRINEYYFDYINKNYASLNFTEISDILFKKISK